jgi:hypothetical protein
MSWCHKRPPVDIMLATTKPPLSLARSIRLGFNRLISTSSLWRPTCCRSCKFFCSSSLTPRTNKLERLYLPSFFRQFHSLLVSPEPSWRREREHLTSPHSNHQMSYLAESACQGQALWLICQCWGKKMFYDIIQPLKKRKLSENLMTDIFWLKWTLLSIFCPNAIAWQPLK